MTKISKRVRSPGSQFKLTSLAVLCMGLGLGFSGNAAAIATDAAGTGGAQCARTVTADVVAMDQPIIFNRLGAQNVNYMVYALRDDVVNSSSGMPESAGGQLLPGRVQMRADKRLRPLVLRVAAGDCLTVNFTNLLAPQANPFNANGPIDPDTGIDILQINDQIEGRVAGFHPQGLELVTSIADDSSFVGRNPNSLAAPGESRTYHYYAPKENTYMVYSEGQTFGGEASGGNVGVGLFGVVTVGPAQARMYRGVVTEEEMRLATTGTTANGMPIIDYEARFPMAEPWASEGKAGKPVLNMIDPRNNRIVHTEIDAITAGPNADGSFPASTYPLESRGLRNPTVPNRLEAFRDFTVVFHDEQAATQVFPKWFNHPILSHTLHGVRDAFMINYGVGGIGSEIIANRLGVGPMHDCLSCAYEEFFLTAFTVGDVGELVDIPANVGLELCSPDDIGGTCLPFVGPKATEVLFPGDPANVHHSYTGDFVKFRNLHAGPKEQHVFHLHNHQWLFNANDDNSNYLDAQGIGPGSGYTYEINFGGSGNRNKTTGDAIFHCHFYPHFAQGMWEMWRNHDVLETGTVLEVSGGPDSFHSSPFALKHGRPAAGSRALPDGEVLAGKAIPAIVPLPGKAMAPLPGKVIVVTKDANGDGIADSSQARIIDRDVNPGYPFWIASIEDTVGQRPPTPPMDMLTENDAPGLGINPVNAGGWNGGLPRHTLDGILAVETPGLPGRLDPAVLTQHQTRLDMSKEIHKAKPYYFAEGGTDIERVAMKFHAQLFHRSFVNNLDGTVVAGRFRTNGQAPQPSAPLSEPCIDDEGDLLTAGNVGDFFSADGGLNTKGVPKFGAFNPRTYKAANIQIDAVFNKAGYHYPQERIIALWEDVLPTINKIRPPEPFVIRLNTFDCAKYLHTNLVPKEFELDDYQIKTPTDIIGQHIHLPKWDLAAADGSGNGWNYEDGTLAPGAVVERIVAINHFNEDPRKTPVPTIETTEEVAAGTTHLVALPHPFFGTGVGGEYLGARTTIQRWFADPVVNVDGFDRGLGIIFTHDHYGPSTHQQIGLYATVLTEPARSTWKHNETGEQLYTRADGGPTSWQAAILPSGDQGANTVGADSLDPFREFYFEFSDFQHAYQPGVYVGANQNGRPPMFEGGSMAPNADTFRDAINPSYRQQAARQPGSNAPFPDIVRFPAVCPGGVPRPCPEAITADDSGMLVVNYRQEPVGLRVYDPNKIGPDGKPGMQADGKGGDLAYALQSRTDRAITDMNRQPQLGDTAVDGGSPFAIDPTRFPNPINAGGVEAGDPFTPMIRANAGDMVRIKIQAGGHEHEHNASIHGMKWLQAGSGHGAAPNSGWRNSQNAGISEQFTFSSPVIADLKQRGNQADYAYSVDASQDGWWSGMWGVMRVYDRKKNDLFSLPNSIDEGDIHKRTRKARVVNRGDFDGVCPKRASVRNYDIAAVLANEVLGNELGATLVPADPGEANMHVGGPVNANGGTLVYNPRNTQIAGLNLALDDGTVLNLAPNEGPLHDPTSAMYVLTKDLVKRKGDPAGRKWKLRDGIPVEPLTLRAAAGDCIKVTLRNRLPKVMPDLAGYNTLLQIVRRDRNSAQGMTTFNNNLIRPSAEVGLHMQLVEYDVTRSDGVNVGSNPRQTVNPGGKRRYAFYAGDLAVQEDAYGRTKLVATPVEFGGFNLSPADKIKQGQKGLVGAGVILPEGAKWSVDKNKRSAGATIYKKQGLGYVKAFRDFTIVHQKGLNMRFKNGTAVQNIASEGLGLPEDSHDAGQMAINYGSEPLWFRFGLHPAAPFGNAGAGSFGAVANVHEAYSNGLGADGTTIDPTDPLAPEAVGDPVTAVFEVNAGTEARLRLLAPTGVGRGTTFTVHGHNWLRDPYVCDGSAKVGLVGKCETGEVASRNIGDNPLGITLGHQESITPMAHFDVVLPSAGGSFGIAGDYLFRDTASFGNTSGLWGIMRVNGRILELDEAAAAAGLVIQEEETGLVGDETDDRAYDDTTDTLSMISVQ